MREQSTHAAELLIRAARVRDESRKLQARTLEQRRANRALREELREICAEFTDAAASIIDRVIR